MQTLEDCAGRRFSRARAVRSEVAEKAARAVFVTTGAFTKEASAFAHGKPLELVDGEALAKLVEGVQTSQAAQATTATLACPKCGGEMVQRVAKRGAKAGKTFWGCRRYPQCYGVRDGA